MNRERGAFGIGEATFDRTYWMWCIAVPMMVGVIGLLRLRTRGLIVNAATNVAMIALVATRAMPLPSPLRELFIGSAIAQLAIPLPMLITIVRRRTPDSDAWRRLRAPFAIILAIVAFSCWAGLPARSADPVAFVAGRIRLDDIQPRG